MKYEDFFPQQNIGSILKDDAILLSGLIKILKPKIVVEIGTFVGASTITMALAMKENGYGTIYTVDKNDHNVSEKAKEFDVEKHIHFSLCDSYDFSQSFNKPIDMVFYDGEATIKQYKRHFDALRPRMAKGGLYVVHDHKTRAEAHRAFLEGIYEPHIVINTQKGISIIQV